MPSSCLTSVTGDARSKLDRKKSELSKEFAQARPSSSPRPSERSCGVSGFRRNLSMRPPSATATSSFFRVATKKRAGSTKTFSKRQTSSGMTSTLASRRTRQGWKTIVSKRKWLKCTRPRSVFRRTHPRRKTENFLRSQ